MRGKELPLNRRGIEAAQSEKKPGRFGSRTLGLSSGSCHDPVSPAEKRCSYTPIGSGIVRPVFAGR